MTSTPATVVVFVPGTTASCLQTPSTAAVADSVWPEVTDTLLPLGQTLRLTADLTGTLAVKSLVNYMPTQPLPAMVYGGLIEYFTTGTNFTNGQAFTAFTYNTDVANGNNSLPVVPKLFYMVPYDWRLDNVNSAQWLNNALNYLDQTYTKAGQSYNLYIMAHSMGGLVSRYLLENSTLASPPPTVVKPGNWFAKAQMLITLATPHLGAPLALAAALGEQIAANEPAAMIELIRTIVNNVNFPSTFELIPPESVTFVSDTSKNPVDIYDASNSQLYASFKAFGLNTQIFPISQNFFEGLAPANVAPPINYFFYYGDFSQDQQPNPPTTLVSFTYSPGKLHVLPSQTFQPSFSTAGDRIVPTSSSSYPAKANGTSTTVTRQIFPNYTHGQMGGCDMTNSPASILAAATAMGLGPVATVSATREAVPA